MRIKLLSEEIVIPDKVTVEVNKYLVTVKGPKGELKREFRNKQVSIEKKDNKVIVFAKDASKREKTMVGTFASHIKNMTLGVQNPHIYKLKICSGHFPMSVAVSGSDFVVKNFLGETVPRKFKIKPGVTVKVDGDFVVVDSINKELASQTAANVEQLVRITNRDRRVFQDGIWIIEKDSKKVE